MKITISPTWTSDGQHQDGWQWWLSGDNGATLARSVRRYRARTDAIAAVLRVLGLALPKRRKGSRATATEVLTPRGLYVTYVAYGSGGMVLFAQWSPAVDENAEFFELVEG